MAQNAAYDLSLFEKKKKEQVIRLEPKKAPRPKPQRRFGAVRVMAVAVLVVGVLSLALFSRAQLTELSAAITTAEEEYNAAQSEAQRLQLQMDAGVTLKKVEEVAAAKLGLVKQGDYQVNYVTLTTGNAVEVTEEDNSILGQVVRFFTGLFGGKES